MKYKFLFPLFLLLPLIAFAGGNKHHEYPPPPPVITHPPEPIKPKPIIPKPIPKAYVNIANLAQNTPKNVSSGGNGQIYCSSPSSVGWNVSLPNGGCKSNPRISKAELQFQLMKALSELKCLLGKLAKVKGLNI